MGLNVANGAELTVDGSVRVSGTPGFQGSLLKSGGGTLYADGCPSVLTWELHNGNGNTVFKDGAVFTFTVGTSGGPGALSVGSGSVTVTGAGTLVTNLGGIAGLAMRPALR